MFLGSDPAQAQCETHVNAEGDQVFGVLEVVGDGLRQVERQLDELKGGAGICGGEDYPTLVFQHWDVCRQYHLGIQCSIDNDVDEGDDDDDDGIINSQSSFLPSCRVPR